MALGGAVAGDLAAALALAGIGAIAGGNCCWPGARRGPQLLVAADARTIALRGADGRLAFMRPPKDQYAARNWLQRDGDGRAPQAVPAIGHCDAQGCVATVDGLLIAAPLQAASSG